MKRETFLFVGGHQDGRRIEVDMPTVFIPTPSRFRDRNAMAETYTLRTFLSGRRPHFLYALQSLADADILLRLIEGYRSEPAPLTDEQFAALGQAERTGALDERAHAVIREMREQDYRRMKASICEHGRDTRGDLLRPKPQLAHA